MRPPTYYLVVPVTHRAGPGHRAHLSPDGRRTTLCKVENNARGLQRLGFQSPSPGTLKEILQWYRKRLTCRTLCANCQREAERTSRP